MQDNLLQRSVQLVLPLVFPCRVAMDLSSVCKLVITLWFSLGRNNFSNLLFFLATLALRPLLHHNCLFVCSSDSKSGARCLGWEPSAEDQQKPGALRHHVDLLRPRLGDSGGPWLSVSAERRWREAACTAAVSNAGSPISPKSGSPPLFSHRPLRKQMITVAEKAKGYGLKKIILQWPPAGSGDWEAAGRRRCLFCFPFHQ